MVTADVEAAFGGWLAVQHFAPRGGPGSPGPPHGRARSKILPGHDCARLRPHGTALLLAKAEYSVLESVACDSPSRLALGEAAVMPRLRFAWHLLERSLHGFAWAQYEATAPEIPQLTMEPELAIVVVETGKAPNARVGARSLRSSGLSNRDEKPSIACGFPAQSPKHEMSVCIWYKKVLLRGW